MAGEDDKTFGLKESHVLLALFLASLVLRVAYTLFLRFYLGHPIINDELIYHAHASNLLKSGNYCVGIGQCCPCAFKAYSSPGLPLLLFIIYTIFGKSIALAGAFNALLSAFIAPLVYTTGKRVFNRKVAFIAAIIAVIYPYYIYYSPLLVTETLITLLPLVSIFFLLKHGKSNSSLHLVLSAVFLGISTLVKPVTIFLPSVVILYFMFKRGFSLKKFVSKSALYCLAFLVVLSPWAIRNYLVLGIPIFTNTNTGKTFFGGNNFFPSRKLFNVEIGTYQFDSTEIDELVPGIYGEKSEPEVDTALMYLGFKELKKNYTKIPQLLFMKFIKFWSVRPDPTKPKWTSNDTASLFTYGVILIFFIIGFFKTFRIRDDIFIFHLVILYYLIVALVFWGTPRFRLPASPYIIIISSAVMFEIWESFISKLRHNSQ